MDMNSLQQWMDFAHKNGLFSQYQNSGNGFQPTVFNVPMMEANWARGMAGSSAGSMPGYASQNFFANLSGPPSAVSIGDNPYSARAQAVQSAPYQAPQGLNNYLVRLMR